MAIADDVARIATDRGIRPAQVAAALGLLDGGNTVPFIARYRKEATGSLDEEQLRAIEADIARWRALHARRATILASIEAQGRLTEALHRDLLAATSQERLEDLYRPYRPKRKTRAAVARERGLAPLAELIRDQVLSSRSDRELAEPFVSESVPTPDDALAGARDIVAEAVSDDAEVRRAVRRLALDRAVLTSTRLPEGRDERAVYELYYALRLPVARLRPHQVLAINRGESEGVLRVGMELAEREWAPILARVFRVDRRSPMAGQLAEATRDGAGRLLLPSVGRDVRRTLSDRAETHAIRVFADNLRALLEQPPLGGHHVLGIDPGLRSGCKLAVVDPTGRVLATATVYPHPPGSRSAEALAVMDGLVGSHGVTLVAIGNGTAGRETEALVAELIRSRTEPGLRYVMASEAGASVYSASRLARAELPELDVSLRGAVSIARRVQDPLAELVKIEPRAIGVGMYQHDVDQARLARALDAVVETVVNAVGVDGNTASAALLARVVGIGPRLAEAIVAHRDRQGPLPDRQALRRVRGLGPKAFEQCAGFVRIHGGREPLDASAIHPESYDVARGLLVRAGLTAQVPPGERSGALSALVEGLGSARLAADLGAGEPTVADILEQLVRPERDPRSDVPPPLLRADVLHLADLRTGMSLLGTVRNVVDFGAFVDVGVKTDGLLHCSRLPRDRTLSVGDVIEVVVVSIEPERGRIGLAWPDEAGA